MEIQKVITLMGDRISLSFFVNEEHTFEVDKVAMWFEDSEGKSLDSLGDNYSYFAELSSNKEEIKKALKELLSNEKGLFKEVKILINKMNEYKKL
jgi:hypothetical protein